MRILPIINGNGKSKKLQRSKGVAVNRHMRPFETAGFLYAVSERRATQRFAALS